MYCVNVESNPSRAHRSKQVDKTYFLQRFIGACYYVKVEKDLQRHNLRQNI